MKKIIAVILVVTMTLALCIGLTSCGEESSDVDTIRVGYMANYASLWAVLTGIEKGYFAEENLKVELVEFGDGAAEIAAMSSNTSDRIDLAYIGKGAHRLCIIGQAIIFAPSSVHTSDKLVCAKDSGIQSVNDLKGKKIGYSAGSSSETTMNGALAAAGLTLDDVQAFNLEPANIVPAMVSGDIDVAVTWNPYSSNCLAQCEGSYEIEFSDGSTNMSSWICLPSYAEQNHDLLVRYTRALYKAMDYGSDPDHADEVAGWCANQTKTSKDSNLTQWGDAHWFNKSEVKAALDDGTMKTYYEGVQNDMLAAGNITEAEKKDSSEWVLYDIMNEAMK